MSDCVLAIDPGNKESAYCIIRKSDYRPIAFEKCENKFIPGVISGCSNNVKVAIEMVASYGMPVGREVFETCVWIGRFMERALSSGKEVVQYVYREEEKLNICKTKKANDSSIRKALIDRFAEHDLKNGKGTKGNPDWFYGFKADIWQAYAVGVTFLDREREETEQHGHTA